MNTRILSASALIENTKSDPVLLDRYKRHYAMDLDALLSYFATFRIAKLEATLPYRVFGVSEDGKIHSTVQVLNKGTLVFVDLSGAPAMRVICGNPMNMGPADPLAPSESGAELTGEQQTTLRELIASEEPTVADLVQENVLFEPTVDPVPDAPLPTPGTPPETVTVPINATQVRVPGSGIGNFLPALLLLTPLQGSPGPTAPVPEPSSLIAFCVGLGGMALKRRASQKAK